MASISFNARNGISLGNSIPLADALGNVTATSLTVSGASTLSTLSLTSLSVSGSVSFSTAPTGITSAQNTNSTALATTAFVLGQKGIAIPLMDSTGYAGISTLFAPQDHVHPSDTSRATSINPSLSGTVSVSGNTVTSSAPFLTMSQTWNNPNTTFSGIFANITNTASNSNSLILNFQLNGIQQFGIAASGTLIQTVTSSRLARTIISIPAELRTIREYQDLNDWTLGIPQGFDVNSVSEFSTTFNAKWDQPSSTYIKDRSLAGDHASTSRLTEDYIYQWYFSDGTIPGSPILWTKKIEFDLLNSIYTFNGAIHATSFSGIGTNITGTAIGLSIGGNSATATNVAYSGLTGTIPTWNQNTTGNAATANIATQIGTITTPGSIGYTTNNGFNIWGKTGTSQDFAIYNPSNTLEIMYVPTGTLNTVFGGSITAPSFIGNLTGTAATATNVAYTGLTGTIPTWNQNTTGNAATATNVAYTGLTGTIPTWNQNTTGNAATATTATTASHLNNSVGVAGVYNWSGQPGQPSWVWGGTDGTNFYVYNPSNFSVAFATNASNVTNGVYTIGTQIIGGTKTFTTMPVLPIQSMIRLNTSNGAGSTNIAIRRFLNIASAQGTDITYIDSATLGANFTINTAGVYAISYNDQLSAAAWVGVSLNTINPTLAIPSCPAAEILCAGVTGSTGWSTCVSYTGYFPVGSVIRPHTAGTSGGTTQCSQFTIVRVS